MALPRCFPAREPCACAPAPVEHAAEKERAAGAGRGGTGERDGEQPVCRVALAALTLGCVELALGPEGTGARVGVGAVEVDRGLDGVRGRACPRGRARLRRRNGRQGGRELGGSGVGRGGGVCAREGPHSALQRLE